MATARRPSQRRRKPQRRLAPVADAPAAACANQQRDGSAVAAEPAPPLALVFADAECHAVRQAVDLGGFRVSDRWLARARALLPADQPPAVRVFALDGSARAVTARGIACFLSALAPDALRCLRLTQCPELDAAVVASDVVPTTLVELDVSSCEWVDDHFARVVARKCLSLVRIVLARCRRITDYGVAAFAEQSAAKTLGFAATPGATRRISCLDISYCTKVTDSGVLALLMATVTTGLRLKELLLVGLPLVEGLNLLGLPRFGVSSAAIETLSLAQTSNLRVSAIATLARVGALANIKKLDLSSCSLVDDDALQALCICSDSQGGTSRCPELTVISLAFCSDISDAGIALLLGAQSERPETQVALRPASSGKRPSSHVTGALLKRIDITGCFRLTDDSAISIANACPFLESLIMDGVRRIGSKGVRALMRRCLQLCTIRWGGILVRGSANGGSGDFFSIPQLSSSTIASLELAPRLHTLHIGNTQCDVEALAVRISQNTAFGGQLVDLDITGIATDELCKSISATCKYLRTLRISRSRYFSEASFLLIPAACPRLETLDLESCEQIRDAGIEGIAQNCPMIERLNLANDWQVTDRGISALGMKSKHLKELNVRHCPEVSLLALHSVSAKIGNNLLVVSNNGLILKHPNVVAFLRGDNKRRAAARKITRWLKPKTSIGRRNAKSAMLLALSWIRYRKKCVVRIQQRFRNHLMLKRQRELLLEARKARSATLHVNLRLLHAFCAFTKQLRAFMRHWLAEKQRKNFLRAEAARQAREDSAICIQRYVRGQLARRRAAALRHLKHLKHERKSRGAVDIERVYRGFKAREKVLLLRATLGKSMRTEIADRDAWFILALQLQRAARGCLCRRAAKQRVIEIEERRRLRQKSARCIQRAFRAFVARVALRNLLFRSARAIQRVFRGFVGRKCARVIVLARSYTFEPFILFLRDGRTSIYTRELAILWKQKRDCGLIVAENLQRLYRGFVGRLRFRVALAACRQQDYRVNSAARTLQHFFRSLMILKRIVQFSSHLHLRRCSVTAIQATWRMWQAKALAFALRLRDDRRRKHTALLHAMGSSGNNLVDIRHSSIRHRRRYRSLLDEAIARQRRHQQQQQIRQLMEQSRPREHSSMSSLRLLQLGAINILVHFYRTQLAQRGWQSPSYIRLLHTSATRIQSIVRGYLARVFAAAYRRELEAATRLVQRVWRGKLGKQAWRRLIQERRDRQRELDEQDRAGRVAHKRSSQFALEALDRESRFTIILQRWYRTLRNRQVFRECREARAALLEKNARDKLGSVLQASVTGSVVFQARVWRDCVDNRTQLLELEDEDCARMEGELRELQRECLSAHAAAHQAAKDAAFLAKRKSDVEKARGARIRAVESLKKRIQPFSLQAKQLTLESARVHAQNRQLRHELKELNSTIDAFHAQLDQTLRVEALLVPTDVERLLAVLPDSG